MTVRDELIDEYGRADTAPLGTLTELRQKLAAFRAEALREMAAKIREVGNAKGWSVWAAAFMDPDVEFVDTGMPSTESIVAELRRLDRAEVLREAADVADSFMDRFPTLDAPKAVGIIGPHTAAGAIGEELRRMADADAAGTAPTAARPTAVDRLVDEVRHVGTGRPCWVVHRLDSRALIVPLDGSANGYRFAYGLRRDTITAALRAGLITVGALEPVPPYSGGGTRWSWWDGAKGSTITLPLTEGGESR